MHVYSCSACGRQGKAQRRLPQGWTETSVDFRDMWGRWRYVPASLCSNACMFERMRRNDKFRRGPVPRYDIGFPVKTFVAFVSEFPHLEARLKQSMEETAREMGRLVAQLMPQLA